VPGAENLYREALRPQFHYTSRRGWNNDPNGLVYYAGEYHLFYQHSPFSINWGSMHWGHAVSRDLVHWEELGIALYPHGVKDMAFSGGGNVDVANTAGWKTGDEDVVFVTFTSTGRGECVAYSTDRARTLVEYEGNPVVRHKGRDPRVIWYEPQSKWVMIVYDENEEADPLWRYALYESRDLKHWSFMSVVPGFYECPEMFELPLDGDENQRRWIVYGHERHEEGGERFVARSSYMVGTFDGREFHPETPILTGHRGPHFYAAQTFARAPEGRRIMMGWLAGAQYPGMPFSQGFTVPLELSLRTTAAGPRLFFYPVAELEALRREKIEGQDLTADQANYMLGQLSAELLDVVLHVRPEGEDVTLDVRGEKVRYDAAAGTLHFREASAPVGLRDGVLELRMLVDRGVMEVFGKRGEAAFSAGGKLYGAGQESDGAITLAAGPRALVPHLEAHELASAWGV